MILSILFLFVATTYIHAANLKHYENTGVCYDLVKDYLNKKGVAYIIGDELKAINCDWKFKGNIDFDFKTWCEKKGLTCGGNPYFVGFDSSYSVGGSRVPSSVAHAEWREQNKKDSIEKYEFFRNDSIEKYQSPPLPKKSVYIEYLELSKNTAEKLGFSYSDYIGSAEFFSYTDLFSVSLQALSLGDTNFIYRNYSSIYDSTLSVFWGGQKQIKTSSTITESGFLTENLEFQEIGLKFEVNNYQYRYEHSTGEDNKITGAGVLLNDTNKIVGSYQLKSQEIRGISFLQNIPFIGYLFKHTENVSEWRFIFLRVIVKEL